MKNLNAIFALFGFFVISLGCSTTEPNVSTNPRIENNPNTTKVNAPKSVQEMNRLPQLNQLKAKQPLKVAIGIDITASIKTQGMSKPTVEDLTPLINTIINNGGEIAVVTIDGDSDFGMIRILYDEPKPLPTPPVKDPQKPNRIFLDDKAKYDREVNKIKNVEDKSKRAFQPTIDKFKEEVSQVLSRKDAPVTDLSGAIKRADVFLNEKGTFNREPSKYFVAFTDAQDTLGREVSSFKGGYKVFLVNSLSTFPELENFPYERFESFSAAIRRVDAESNIGGSKNE